MPQQDARFFPPERRPHSRNDLLSQPGGATGVRARPIPVIMFSASVPATDEGRLGESARTQAAAFAAVLPKPFDVDELLGIVTEVLRRAEQSA